MLAIAPGTNVPAKWWPTSRFAQTVHALMARNDVWPVVFGGVNEHPMRHELVEKWGCGIMAVRMHSVRHSAALLEQCVIYLGNDTVVVHLAAATGTPCVAVFRRVMYQAPGMRWGSVPRCCAHKDRVRVVC
jgi:ADP-heptose:LPS heptosyltransferase